MIMVKILQQVALGLWGIMPGNYSGITHVNDNLYAIVDDKDRVDGFKYLTLDIDSVSGKIEKAALVEPSGMALRRSEGVSTHADCEGVAFFNDGNTVFVTSEEYQRIMEYTLEGVPTGRELAIPSIMTKEKIVPNLGFEALTYNPHQQRFWTTTESTLIADGEVASAKNPDVHNHLRFVSFDTSLQPRESYVYEMDLPEGRAKARDNVTSVHGVPSLLALDDGRLIVMEREGYLPGKGYGSWVKIKLYIVDPRTEQTVSMDTKMSDIPHEQFMKKELLCSFVTRLRLGEMNISNYEGMCLGPKLTDGRQTIILIADSQNGRGNSLYRIKDHVRVIVW